MCRVDRFLYISDRAAIEKEGEDISWSDKKNEAKCDAPASGESWFYLMFSVEKNPTCLTLSRLSKTPIFEDYN